MSNINIEVTPGYEGSVGLTKILLHLWVVKPCPNFVLPELVAMVICILFEENVLVVGKPELEAFSGPEFLEHGFSLFGRDCVKITMDSIVVKAAKSC